MLRVENICYHVGYSTRIIFHSAFPSCSSTRPSSRNEGDRLLQWWGKHRWNIFCGRSPPILYGIVPNIYWPPSRVYYVKLGYSLKLSHAEFNEIFSPMSSLVHLSMYSDIISTRISWISSYRQCIRWTSNSWFLHSMYCYLPSQLVLYASLIYL